MARFQLITPGMTVAEVLGEHHAYLHGTRVAAFYSKIHGRVLRPLVAAQDHPPADRASPRARWYSSHRYVDTPASPLPRAKLAAVAFDKSAT